MYTTLRVDAVEKQIERRRFAAPSSTPVQCNEKHTDIRLILSEDHGIVRKVKLRKPFFRE